MGQGFFVYILRCADQSLYTGWTTDPDKRLRAHNAGRGAKYTRSRLPVERVYLEEHPTKSAACRREAELKKLTRARKLTLIEGGHTVSKKLISWNVNGLRACLGKGFLESVAALDADIVSVQETKMQEGQAEVELPGYHQYWNSAEKKGYSGTAVFSRQEPLRVTRGIGIPAHDAEGRVLTLEFDGFYLVNVYTPNSQKELARLDYRMQWEDAFQDYLHKLDGVKPVIVCGDMNVAHREIDLKNPKTNRKNAGFTDEERSRMTRLLEGGFTDSFRKLYPDLEGAYSWWSYLGRARDRNAGWRIDYFLVSNRLAEQIEEASIHSDIHGSDHCPVGLVIRL